MMCNCRNKQEKFRVKYRDGSTKVVNGRTAAIMETRSNKGSSYEPIKSS